MNTVTLDGWRKPEGAAKSTPIGLIHFRVSESDHLRLEEAEEELNTQHKEEKMLEVDMKDMELELPKECGQLADCQFRVYLSPGDNRGHFHLVGHQAGDGSLVYTSTVMVDQLG